MSIKMGLLIGFLVLAATIMSQGMIWVEVQERSGDQMHLQIPIPVSLVSLAVAAVPNDEIVKATKDAAQWLPAIEAACRELERIPDTVLVEVHDKQDNVRIEKRGGSLYLDVDSREEEVHVSFPVHAVTDIVAEIAEVHARRS